MFLQSFIGRLSTVLLFGVVLMSTVEGVSSQNNCAVQNDCCCLTNCPEAPQCGLGYNPSAYMQCGNQANCGACNSLSGRFDILYWRPCSDGLELGKSESLINSEIGEDTVLTNESHAADPNFKFDTGFRLGFGYYSPCDCWDAALNWTHFHSKASADGASDPTNNIFFMSDWVRDAGTNFTVADARWTLDLDLLDLEFAKTYFVNHCFILRPFIGLRAARIDQGYHVEATGTIQGSPASNSVSAMIVESFDSVVKSSSDFRGIGPRAGFCAEIRLGCGVSLIGGAAASLVFGTFDRSSKEGQLGNVANVNEFNYDAHGGGPDRCTVTMADLGIGLKWEHCFECCGCMHPFAFIVAWEHHAFYDLNHFNFATEGLDKTYKVNGIHNGKTGDLTMQGVTFSAMLGF